jgi:hypothetical protein
MTAILAEHQYWIENGAAIVNASVYFGLAGQNPQTNPKAVFSDIDLTVAADPKQLTDADGRIVNKLYLEGRYSIEVVKSNLVTNYINLFNGSIGAEETVPTKKITASNSPFDTTLDDANSVIQIDATNGPVIVNLLPAFDAGSGSKNGFKRLDNVLANTVTITGDGSEPIEGQPNLLLVSQNQAVELFSTGVSIDGWLISPNDAGFPAIPGAVLIETVATTSGATVDSSIIDFADLRSRGFRKLVIDFIGISRDTTSSTIGFDIQFKGGSFIALVTGGGIEVESSGTATEGIIGLQLGNSASAGEFANGVLMIHDFAEPNANLPKLFELYGEETGFPLKNFLGGGFTRGVTEIDQIRLNTQVGAFNAGSFSIFATR